MKLLNLLVGIVTGAWWVAGTGLLIMLIVSFEKIESIDGIKLALYVLCFYAGAAATCYMYKCIRET